ncbi:hypothetical protein BHE74_00048607 [Ensete ventricosum]|uniref:non-specific serine/threonine protein kinase n=1 Tax=Ensete ventricosum TaxID=4639 RepID=A0A426YZ32_ENSVE|nr:hypothetical protein B296_00047543 [Ensete ventricosum]RWW45549.1 hypothetical protein BHE74_00048607 [Ensete ventricosum]
MLTKKSKFTKIDRLRPIEPTLNLAYRPVNAFPSFPPRLLHSRSATHTKTTNQPCLSPSLHVSNLRLVLRQKHDDPLDVNVAYVSDLASLMGNTCRGSLAGNKYLPNYSGPVERSSSSSSSDSTPRRRRHRHHNHVTSLALANPTNPESDAVTMRRSGGGGDTWVLGHKTASLRDLYTLGRKLGQGQFGTTYLCTEGATGKEFACKSISKRKLTAKEDVEDVRREIQIMHHLSGHRNVVTIKGAYEDPLYVHIVMELCEGGELFDRIIQRGHYSERKAAELIRIVVGVVEACHSLGVMHRDLKPENFLLANKDDDSSLKAIDFGLSVFFKPGKQECYGREALLSASITS